ncbi:hypothetical protein [Vibrio fortis]
MWLADGSDFTGVASVTIPAGSTTAELNIMTINDGIMKEQNPSLLASTA